ncbi:SHOCT domain-containing protein [Chitinimonas viridis]|uniref:SHOCT domain-containing protein n=1 Tax=Chitinimonas viridis TaxID=664880 RepID=A0ABT8BBI7_9NEIS|nr:SHOCT domain-containing protein [Chitinimonas viridis]MDN3578936.1 SHOCT domain-containing protein [Chitinimonas viridis]
MQQAFASRLGRLALVALMVSSASAMDSSQRWSETDDYVKLEAVNAGNQHPVSFSSEQLRALLAHFYKLDASRESVPYFSEDEIERLSKSLIAQFAKAKTEDDLLFGTSYRPGSIPLLPRSLNAGRLFVENGRLNLLVGMCGSTQEVLFQRPSGSARTLIHGSRIKSQADLGCELQASNVVQRVGNRPDWVSLDIPTALATKPTTTFGTAKVPAATTFKPADTVTAPAPVSPAPAQAAPQSAPAATAAPQAILPAAPTSKVEERLILLKRLKDNGLIDDAEYAQKRAAILKEL